jgi:putative peptidoglycan lipid II flippase
MIAEAFFVAQRIPNLFRDLVGEGAANAAIVPVLVEYKKKRTREQWHQLINILLAWAVIVLGIITLLGILLAPWIVRLMAPGFIGEDEKYFLTVDLTRIMFPFLILIALTALQMGVLYTLNSFTAPAFSSCLFNVAMILSSWVAAIFSWGIAYILAAGVLLGGILQLWLQQRALAKQGFIWRWPARLQHEGMDKIRRLLMPRIWGSAVYQINIFIDTLCASMAVIVGPGGIAAIYFANRLVQLPLGVFAYSLSSASLPNLSSSADDKDLLAFKQTLFFSLKSLLFVLLPCSVMLGMLSFLVVKVLFQHGAFDEYSAQITSSVLLYLSIGIPFFGCTKVLVSAFYALQDTKTPVRVATVCLLINGILNVLLMFPMKISGIALASSIAGMANFIMLLTTMNERLGGSKGLLRKFLLRMVPSLMAMSAVILLSMLFIPGHAIIKLSMAVLAGTVIFFVCCHYTKVPEYIPLWKAVKKTVKRYIK